MTTLMRSLRSALLCTVWLAACAGGAPNGDSTAPDDQPRAELGGQSEALRAGGFNVATCPGGGSPKCAACSDGETCTYACAGGYFCDIGPSGDDGSKCSPSGQCMTFTGSFTTFARTP